MNAPATNASAPTAPAHAVTSPSATPADVMSMKATAMSPDATPVAGPDWSALAATVLQRLRGHDIWPHGAPAADCEDDFDDLPSADESASGPSSAPRTATGPAGRGRKVAAGKTTPLPPLSPPPSSTPPRKMSDRDLPQSPLRALAASPEAMQIPPDEEEAVRAAGGDPHATDSAGCSRPRDPLPARTLILALRLCATFRTADRVAEMLAPGAITVLEVGTTDPDAIPKLLGNAFLPEPAKVTTTWPQSFCEDRPVLCAALLKPTDDRERQAAALQRLTLALEQPQPVLAVAGSLAGVPDTLRRLLPAALRLAPLSRDIVMATLRESHSATGKIDPALRARLPSDAVLARMAWPTFAAALRAEQASGVAERLCALTAALSTGEPTLDMIEGYGEAEAVARRMVADLQGWAEGRIPWHDVQRSVLFYGAPGTGKSHLARAMGHSAGVTLVRGSFAAWQACGHLGHMLRAMRASFAEAAAARPAVFVIDEIDAVGSRTGPDLHGASYRLCVVNAFLEEMDGLRTMEGVLVVGTCNHPDLIDAAVLRTGRIDLKCEVPLPGTQALARMIREGLRDVLGDLEARAATGAPDVTDATGRPVAQDEASAAGLARLTRAAAGLSAADVEGALRQARAVARAEGRPVTVEDVRHALAPDPENESLARDYRIAIHECGHAIVGTCLGIGQVQRLVLANATGVALIRLALREDLLPDLEADLAHCLAGRAAERLVLGAISAGAGGSAASDLAQATAMAVRIDTRFGLGAEGPVWLGVSEASYLQDPDNAARIRDRLEAAEERAMHVLGQNRAMLIAMAEALEEHRMLEGDRLAGWMDRIRNERESGDGIQPGTG